MRQPFPKGRARPWGMHPPRQQAQKGHLSAISTTLRRLARYGDVVGIRAYIRGETVICHFCSFDSERRHSAMLVYADALVQCEAKSRLPLATPVALNACKRAKLANWGDPARLEKLANAYARAKDHEGRHGF